ncbi:MAG: hypothetical protein HZA01_05425 [Nitrospinae bacterium]|nr:hypothetical protein [Nitrospinota bacterium]
MIEDCMEAMGGVEFEYLFLKDTDLKPCTGCYACMARGEEGRIEKGMSHTKPRSH